MSLQTRLAALAAAVGADIKAVNARIPSTIAMDTWHLVGATGEPAFQNGWVNFSVAGAADNAAFRKYPDGKVRLKGLVKSGSAASTIFTLPGGYHPPVAMRFAVTSNDAYGTVIVNANGAVAISAGNVAYFDLSGIEFDTEAVLQVVSIAAQPIDVIHLVGAAGEPAFQNGWVNFGGGNPPARFRKYPDGRVRLSGLVKSGATGTVAFTLPIGYRPPPGYDNAAFNVQASNGYGQVLVKSDGTVQIASQAGSNVATYAYLDGVEFDTETIATYATGVLSTPTPPLFQAQRTTDFAISGSGYAGPFGFDELYDSNNWYNGSKFQPQQAGWYHINAAMVFSGLGVSNPEVILAKNGTLATAGTTAGIASAVIATRADNWAGGNISKLVFMNGTTDYLEVYCFLATAGTVKGTANEKTFFEGVFVRP